MNICHLEELEDIKGVIKSRKLKKNGQYNGQKKKYIRTKNDLQNKHVCIFNTKDGVGRTPLKTGGELRYPGRTNSSCSTSDTRRINL